MTNSRLILDKHNALPGQSTVELRATFRTLPRCLELSSLEPQCCHHYHRAASKRSAATTSGSDAESHPKLMNPQLLVSSSVVEESLSSPVVEESLSSSVVEESSVPLVVVALGHVSSSRASSSVVKSCMSPIPPKRMPPPHCAGWSVAQLNKGYTAQIVSICRPVRSSSPPSLMSVVVSGPSA